MAFDLSETNRDVEAIAVSTSLYMSLTKLNGCLLQYNFCGHGHSCDHDHFQRLRQVYFGASNVIFGSFQRHLPVEGESLCDCSNVSLQGQSDIGTARR
jgi:hypothetical protein